MGSPVRLGSKPSFTRSTFFCLKVVVTSLSWRMRRNTGRAYSGSCRARWSCSAVRLRLSPATSAAIPARNRAAVDVGLRDAAEAADRLLHLGGRDVLAFPAEGIADAVDEIEIAVLVLAHEIAGTEPGVALLEHVVQDFSAGLGRVGVAFEALAGLGGILEDLA